MTKTPFQARLEQSFQKASSRLYPELSVKWICETYQDFSVQSSKSFDEFIKCLDPHAKGLNSDQIKVVIDKKVAEIQVWLAIELLGQYPSLTTDIWKVCSCTCFKLTNVVHTIVIIRL